MKKKKILTYPTSNRGELSYDLNEKRFNFTHIDFFRQYTYFPFSISHIYQNKDINHGYGKGFLLNLEQTLTKIEGTSKYKLSLPDGSEELFEEIYYYKNEKDQRVYKTDDGLPLQRKDITVIEDGSLRYNEHLIYVDLKSNTGLTLKSDYKDFIGSKEMDFRNEDLISLELEIEQIKQNIEDLEYQCEEYQKYEKTEYHTLEEAKKAYQSASQAVSRAQLDSYNLEKKDRLIGAKKGYYDKISMEDQELGGLILNSLYDEPAYGRILYDKTKKRFTYKDKHGSLALLCEVTSKYEDREFNELDKTILLQDFCNEEFSEEVARLNQALQDISFEIEQDDLNNQKSLFALQNDLSDKEKDYLAKQESYDAIQINRIKDYYQILKERTKTQITQNKNLLKQKEYQKEQYLKQIPELFLYNEDGIVYGYNTFGNLCVLFDAYEHQAFIEFNDRNQIKDIIDTNQHKIEFIYNGKNQLIRMIDDENQFIDFIYEKEYLSQFVYSNGKKFTLKYANHNLAEVLDIDSLGYQLEYNNTCLSSIQFISVSNNAYCLDEKISFQYLENQILVSNQTNSIKTNYLFDEENSLTTEYIEKEDKLDSIQSYEYGSDHCSFAMMSTPQDAKVLDVNEITFSASKQFEVLPLNSYTTDYLLYAFVQADSMDDIRKRRVTAYCSHDFANQNSARRFELRCVLQYASYYKEYSVSFNPKIKGTQFAAIPITFDENSNGQVILPNEINVYVDYIGNKGSCEIQHLAMAQGEYTYCEYDEAHHKIFECSSETVSVKNEILEKKGHFVQKKEIEYQYNPKELLEHQISRIRYEEYDVDAMLVQQKQKEEKITLHYNQQNKVVKQIDSNGNVVDYVYNNQGGLYSKEKLSPMYA
ncbi:hypothetical protein HDR67_00190 [bacterium]|nr:hypothetical protein [bacterium]